MLRERDPRPELLDTASADSPELTGNLADIRRLNRYFGGMPALISHVAGLLPSEPTLDGVTLLDLGTGSGDFPLAVASWAEQHDRGIRVLASDVSADVLDHARRLIAGDSRIHLLLLDARAVDLPDRSVDITTCILALHHFTPQEAVAVLREMRRISRRGFIVNDLRRSALAYLATRCAMPIVTRNRFTRHDAPRSIQRAYTPGELRWLLRRAGSGDARIFTSPWFRMTAVVRTAA